ncbi:OsmC family peroxiredoxin [Ornithobacterium rhinotracheale]|uniref:OsmC family peroxiredoxin n=1 Tax=Ornithobacterium rhinotracheale TaxID=28251 RepID=A0A3R5WZM1_ORNRH|nr:OsmC family protein [Ornithobacterium rhinotracheale]QAR30817.1 OsmC family peroxiredoxin [Ornithobacterium rhinotracheale]
MTSKVIYLGDLRTEATHLASGNVILSDAPVDNNGRGEAFSPTDTVATALASCALTIMGIKAASMNWDITGITTDVTKVMSAEPRRIAKISVVFHIPFKTDEKQRKILEKTAKTCPVYLSLHPEIEKDFQFDWA